MIWKKNDLECIYNKFYNLLEFDDKIEIDFTKNIFIELIILECKVFDNLNIFYVNHKNKQKNIDNKYYIKKTKLYIHLKEEILIKKIIIKSNIDFGIKIYIRKYPGIFLSSATSGWGDRIIALMNAIYLSEQTKFKFGFSWKKLKYDYFDIEDENYVFSKDFIKQYSYTAKKDIIDDSIYDMLSINKISKLKNKPFEHYYGYYTNHYHFIDKELFCSKCDKLFKKIQFSDNINKIINNSKYIFNSNFTNRTIAIHLRRGDMIYSEYRFFHYQYLDKSMPNEILLELVNKNKDKNILLFGEDEKDINNIIDYFKNENINIKSCKNFIPEYISNQTELAIFEIIFMSQCMEIYSYSGFARLASMIKNKKEPNLWLKYFSYEDICHIIEKNLNKIKSDNLQLAYSLFCLFKLSYELNKDNKYLIDILNKAIFYDNNNVLLKLFLIKLLVLEKKYYKADNLAKECYKDNFFIECIKAWKNDLIIHPIDFSIYSFHYLLRMYALIYNYMNDLSKASYFYINFIQDKKNDLNNEFENFNLDKFKTYYYLYSNDIQNNIYYKIGILLIYNTSNTFNFFKTIISIFRILLLKKCFNKLNKIDIPNDCKEYYVIEIGKMFFNLFKKNNFKYIKNNIYVLKKMKKKCKAIYNE
ncbi:hypothetical protein APU46_01585 [Campylobacter jejuni]|nr:hypothetical protein [Campylobacter jejuni]